MTAVTLDTLTDGERADVTKVIADYRGHGWVQVDDAQKNGRPYAPGVRIRHVGHQWPDAFWHGTGIIVAVLTRGDDIELICAYDMMAGTRIAQLGSYHVDLGPFQAVAR